MDLLCRSTDEGKNDGNIHKYRFWYVDDMVSARETILKCKCSQNPSVSFPQSLSALSSIFMIFLPSNRRVLVKAALAVSFCISQARLFHSFNANCLSIIKSSQ